MKQTKKFFIVVGVTIITIIITTSTITTTTEASSFKSGHKNGAFSKNESKNPKIVGTVSSINGTSITINKNNGFKKDSENSTKTYIVDASKAMLNKFTPVEVGSKPTPTLILISDIKVGDTLIIEGTVDGTSINATTITNGSLSQNRVQCNKK